MVGLPDGEKILKIHLFILTQSTNVTNTQTDRQTDTSWRIRPHLMLASHGNNWCLFCAVNKNNISDQDAVCIAVCVIVLSYKHWRP